MFAGNLYIRVFLSILLILFLCAGQLCASVPGSIHSSATLSSLFDKEETEEEVDDRVEEKKEQVEEAERTKWDLPREATQIRVSQEFGRGWKRLKGGRTEEKKQIAKAVYKLWRYWVKENMIIRRIDQKSGKGTGSNEEHCKIGHVKYDGGARAVFYTINRHDNTIYILATADKNTTSQWYGKQERVNFDHIKNRVAPFNQEKVDHTNIDQPTTDLLMKVEVDKGMSLFDSLSKVVDESNGEADLFADIDAEFDQDLGHQLAFVKEHAEKHAREFIEVFWDEKTDPDELLQEMLTYVNDEALQAFTIKYYESAYIDNIHERIAMIVQDEFDAKQREVKEQRERERAKRIKAKMTLSERIPAAEIKKNRSKQKHAALIKKLDQSRTLIDQIRAWGEYSEEKINYYDNMIEGWIDSGAWISFLSTGSSRDYVKARDLLDEVLRVLERVKEDMIRSHNRRVESKKELLLERLIPLDDPAYFPADYNEYRRKMYGAVTKHISTLGGEQTYVQYEDNLKDIDKELEQIQSLIDLEGQILAINNEIRRHVFHDTAKEECNRLQQIMLNELNQVEKVGLEQTSKICDVGLNGLNEVIAFEKKKFRDLKKEEHKFFSKSIEESIDAMSNVPDEDDTDLPAVAEGLSEEKEKLVTHYQMIITRIGMKLDKMIPREGDISEKISVLLMHHMYEVLDRELDITSLSLNQKERTKKKAVLEKLRRHLRTFEEELYLADGDRKKQAKIVKKHLRIIEKDEADAIRYFSAIVSEKGAQTNRNITRHIWLNIFTILGDQGIATFEDICALEEKYTGIAFDVYDVRVPDEAVMRYAEHLVERVEKFSGPLKEDDQEELIALARSPFMTEGEDIDLGLTYARKLYFKMYAVWFEQLITSPAAEYVNYALAFNVMEDIVQVISDEIDTSQSPEETKQILNKVSSKIGHMLREKFETLKEQMRDDTLKQVMLEKVFLIKA